MLGGDPLAGDYYFVVAHLLQRAGDHVLLLGLVTVSGRHGKREQSAVGAPSGDHVHRLARLKVNVPQGAGV